MGSGSERERHDARCPACGRFVEADADGFYDAGVHLDGCEDPDPDSEIRSTSDEVKEREVFVGFLAVFCDEACANLFHKVT